MSYQDMFEVVDQVRVRTNAAETDDILVFSQEQMAYVLAYITQLEEVLVKQEDEINKYKAMGYAND